MSYKNRLLARTETAHNNICMGMDPDLNRIPVKKSSPEKTVEAFYLEILNTMVKTGIFPAAVKPNIAFYESISIDCLKVLEELIKAYQKEGMLVILDAKMGDIGNTSRAYAQAAFKIFSADAVTVNPYMGADSIKPFQDASSDQGIYVLTRTSNATAADLQEKILSNTGNTVYHLIAQKLLEWDDGNLGAVVGATAPKELEDLIAAWVSAGNELPCLIPGVGGQGGTKRDVQDAISNAGGNHRLHLINSSSSINYAWENRPDLKYWEASVSALEDLIKEH